MMNQRELYEYNRNRRICQICFASDDLEKTLKNWVEKFGVGPWKVMKYTDRNVVDNMENGTPVEGEFEQYVALAMFGNTELEVIAPVPGKPSGLRNWLKEHGPGFHHMKEYCSNAERKWMEQEYINRGVPIVSSGKMPPDEYWFVDSEPLIDFKLECGNFAHLEPDALTNVETFWYPAE